MCKMRMPRYILFTIVGLSYVTGSAKTGHNRTSINLQYKALNTACTLSAYLHIIEKIL